MIRAGAILLCILPLGLPQQDPHGIKAAYRELHSKLEPRAEGAEPATRQEQLGLIRSFLDRFEGIEELASSKEVLIARTRLASLLLCEFDLRAAKDQFDQVLDKTAADDRDLRPRALYGLAQVHEMRSKRRRPATPYARSRACMRARAMPPTPRRPPASRDFDREYRRQTSTEIQPPPGHQRQGAGSQFPGWRTRAADLLVPGTPSGRQELRKLLRVARRAGLPSEQILAFGMQADPQVQLQTAEAEGWTMPQISLSSDFLDPIVLAYRVRSLPTSCLIAGDGTLLARNLSPARLADALNKLR